MLSGLPTEILSVVFDNLHVFDRMRANAVLPRSQRIKRPKDKALAVVAYAFRKKLVTKSSISEEIKSFLVENSNEPTVHDLVDEHQIALPKRPVCTRTDFSKWIMQKQSPLVSPPMDANAPLYEIKHALDLISKYATPAQFDMIAAHPAFDMYIVVGDLPYNALLWRNDALFCHLCKTYTTHAMMLDKMRTIEWTRTFAHSWGYVKVLLENADLPQPTIDALLKHTIVNGDFDVAYNMLHTLA